MRALSFAVLSTIVSTVALACGDSSDDASSQTSVKGTSGAAGSGGAAGRGGASAGNGGTAGAGGTSTAGAGGTSAAGAGGTSTAGAGGTSTAGAGGTSTAGAGGTSTAGAGGTNTAGAAGTSTAGAGGTSAAGAGGTSAAGAGGTTAGGGGSATCGANVTAPIVPDTCTADADCVLATPLSECCGPVAYAVPSASLSAWNAAAETYNACKCPQKPACAQDGTAAEDDTTPYIPNALSAPVAKCRQGICVATYESCKAAPDVPRACVGPSDCESIVVSPECCTRAAKGIAKDAREGYEKQLSTYQTACQDCTLVKCPVPVATADDGTKATSVDQKPSVSCQAAVCVTSFGK